MDAVTHVRVQKQRTTGLFYDSFYFIRVLDKIGLVKLNPFELIPDRTIYTR